jgi:hypothetical protein
VCAALTAFVLAAAFTVVAVVSVVTVIGAPAPSTCTHGQLLGSQTVVVLWVLGTPVLVALHALRLRPTAVLVAAAGHVGLGLSGLHCGRPCAREPVLGVLTSTLCSVSITLGVLALAHGLILLSKAVSHTTRLRYRLAYDNFP